ncbi:MAG: DNA polymerase-3 subunit chi [Halocynthiibacter sp.]|jgi:DNA polymerase-3 subunit chi
MGAVYFYHLTHSSLEDTLPMLLAKARGAGWRVAVRGRDLGQLSRLDARLWTHPAESFFAHGLAGGDHDAAQPVLLTTAAEAANDPACVMAIGGAEISGEEVQALERVCILFDGHDLEALEGARGQWRALTGAGCSAQYWSQEGGAWEKKAEA